MTDPAGVAALVKAVTETLGRIDILVNNAGTNIKDRTMRELTVENWDKLVRTNLDGAFYCIREVLPQMLDRKDGVIINVNSVSGKRANPLAGAGYAAGKFGLHAVAGCLAAEEKESGIRVSQHLPRRDRHADPGGAAHAGDGRAAGQDPQAGGRGRGHAVRGRAAAARVRAGADHQADGADVLLRARRWRAR